MPPSAAQLATSRTVFVANLPFDVTEQQLASIFSEVGPVADFVIKFDPATGRTKGYGFCHYYDHETALSAVRNLKEVVVSGRTLRVELSTDEPTSQRNGGAGSGGGAGGDPGIGPGPGPGGRNMNGNSGSGPRGMGGGGRDFSGGPMGSNTGGYTPPQNGRMQGSNVPPPPNFEALPPGQSVPPGMKATDVISKTLSSIPAGKMEEVLIGMKTLVQTSPEQARTLLTQKPQLAYALFQAMLMMNVVDPAILQRMAAAQAQAAPVPPPQTNYPAGGSVPPYPPAAQPMPPSGPPGAPPFGVGMPPRGYGSQPTPPHGYIGTPPTRPGQGPYAGAPSSGPPGYAPPPPQAPQPPQHMGPGAGPYGGSVPPPGPAAPSANPLANPAIQAALSMVPEDQKQMLMQVIQLTPQQVEALPADQKAGVIQLRSQLGL